MFLTLEDPNARIQGSRDPLGVQPVWATSGRHLVTNLTTVTTSIRGFTILILGRLFTEKMIEKGAIGEQDALPIFLRNEQIGSYARYVGHEVTDDIRGIERVKRFVEEGKSTVNIQDDISGLILSDQRVYGLWGIYSVSARASGLVAEGPVGLTDFAREFAEKQYWPTFQPVETKLFRLLMDGGKLKTNKTDAVFRAAVDVLPELLSEAEVQFYAETLRDARHTKGNPAAKRQATFVELLKKHSDLEMSIGREEILRVANMARDVDEAIARRLEKIARLEAIFAPAEAIFDFLQTKNQQKPSGVAKTLRDRWGRKVPYLSETSLDDSLPEIANVVGSEISDAIKICDLCLNNGDYEEAIRALLYWNKLVMATRKAAPWIRIESNKLDVRYRGLEKVLPDGDELPYLWRNPYFIDTLKTITHKLEMNSR